MNFCKASAAMLSAAAISAFALSAHAAERWSMATPWGGGPLLEQGAKGAAAEIELLTNGEITIEVFPGGTLGKALKVTETVSKGVAKIGHNWPGYDWGIDRTGVLFGGFAGTMPHNQMMHWLFAGGGADLWMEWRMDVFNVAGFPCSSLPREIFMHSHKRIETLADYKGVKMRTSGAWAEIAQTLGASTVILAGSEVYPALERKVVDAIEWGGPKQNMDAGYDKIAKYIILPGIHQPNAIHECIVNADAWNGLSEHQQTIMQRAGRLNTYDMYEKVGQDDAIAFVKLMEGPNEIVEITQEFKDAAKVATDKWSSAQGADNPWFAKVWKSQQDYAELWKFADRYR